MTPSLCVNLDPVPRPEGGSGFDPNFNPVSNPESHRLHVEYHRHGDSRNSETIQDEIDEFHHLQSLSSTHSARLYAAPAAAPTEDTVSCLDFDQAGGQPRYYGPASRLYIHEFRHAVQPSVEPEVESDFLIDIDSSQIQKQLLFLFWHVQVLPAAVVDENLFRAGRAAGGRSQYYSGFLQDSLLACASRASTSSTLRGLGEKYIERAKKEIAHEIEHPNLASLQGFLLLSDFEATQGRDRAGWIYCGTACRLLFDLGLQEDCSKLVEQGRLTVEDAGMRQNAFLLTFIFDQFWKLYLGRPSSISEAALTAVRSSTRGMAVNPAVDAYVSLCVQVSTVTDFLNSRVSAISTSDLKARITELDAQIQNCYRELPTSLKDQRLNSSEMEPAAYGINLQFCGIRIVLHRLLSRVEGDRRGKLISGTQHDMDPILASSNSIVHDNAVQVAKLIRAYRRIFGVDRVATIMLDNMYIAAQALIQHITGLENRGLPHSTDLGLIRVLADTMKDSVVHYPVTARMRSTLARLADSSNSLRGMFGQYFGRPLELPTAPLNDFSLPAGAWGTIDSFLDFDLPESCGVNVDAMFSGN